MKRKNTEKVKTVFTEIDYSTNRFPFIDSTEVEIEYETYDYGDEIYYSVVNVYVSEKVPEKWVDGIKEEARVKFYDLKLYEEKLP